MTHFDSLTLHLTHAKALIRAHTLLIHARHHRAHYHSRSNTLTRVLHSRAHARTSLINAPARTALTNHTHTPHSHHTYHSRALTHTHAPTHTHTHSHIYSHIHALKHAHTHALARAHTRTHAHHITPHAHRPHHTHIDQTTRTQTHTHTTESVIWVEFLPSFFKKYGRG